MLFFYREADFPRLSVAVVLLLKLMAAWLLSSSVLALAEPEFVGSAQCQSCHKEQFEAWQQSHHFQAMQPANDSTVLGDFNNVTVNFHDIETRFFKAEGRYFVNTSNAEGKPQEFEVLYTFGFDPLQQYIVDIGDGRWQLLNVAWDSRPKEQGGQRWYHLQPDENITPDHPFFWARHFQNWNSRCAECHSTNVAKNYDAKTHSYKTEFSEVNVACEACHGPAKEHLQLARTGKLATRKKDDSTGFAISPSPSNYLDMCGACHSRRSVVGSTAPLSDFHQNYVLTTLDENLYFPDGQIQDEVFVMGSFLQSKMSALGVTCNDCHNPHSGKLKKQGDALCLQCHEPELANKSHYVEMLGQEISGIKILGEAGLSPDAPHEKLKAEQQCVDCHMPETTYMGVDPRRDHRFHIPAKEYQGWAAVNAVARGGDSTVNQQLAETVSEPLPAIIRATLFNQLARFPSPISMGAVLKGLEDDNPMVRRAAVSALQYVPAEHKLPVLEKLRNDKNLPVRMEVAVAYLDTYQSLSQEQRKALEPLLQEYEAALRVSQDMPATQLNLAYLYRQTGEQAKAFAAYQQALRIAPSYVPALVNLADFYRFAQQDSKALPLLQRAVKIAPDSADAQHALGLYWVRAGDYQTAIQYLEQAVRQDNATSRHLYVYVVALDSVGLTEQGIGVLKAGVQRWSNQYELLHLLVQLLRKAGRDAEAEPYLMQLKQFTQ